MSQELIAVEIIKISLTPIQYDIKCDEKLEKNGKEPLEKMSKSYFQLVFFLIK
jgi:hypothetical protein